MRIASLFLVTCCLVWPGMALAQQWLEEHEAGAPFQLAVLRQIGVQVLPYDSQAGFTLASVLPPETIGLDVVQFKWPKSELTCQLGVGQTSPGYGQQLAMPLTYFALQAGAGAPRLVPGTENGLAGVVARVCVWATALNGEAQLVFLYTCSEGPDDSEVRGFIVSPDGTLTTLNTGHAATLYGWFECGDLNEDGAYELVTSRSLDASPGGFFYHAVRTYEPAQQAYTAQPEAFKEYFAAELKWLDWVLSTREVIQSDPAQYMHQQEYGHIYTADYEGITYGFDSIIELPDTFTQIANVNEYNSQRRESLRLIRAYRDELRAWLDGTGAYPAAWKLSHD